MALLEIQRIVTTMTSDHEKQNANKNTGRFSSSLLVYYVESHISYFEKHKDDRE